MPHAADIRPCAPATEPRLSGRRRRVYEPGTLFHVTFDAGTDANMPEAAQTFEACPAPPSRPWSRSGPYKESTIPRVAFSPSLAQALTGVGLLSGPIGRLTYQGRRWRKKRVGSAMVPIRLLGRVYTNVNVVNAYRPTHAMVPDVEVTGEVWATVPVELRLVGELPYRMVMRLARTARRAYLRHRRIEVLDDQVVAFAYAQGESYLHAGLLVALHVRLRYVQAVLPARWRLGTVDTRRWPVLARRWGRRFGLREPSRFKFGTRSGALIHEATGVRSWRDRQRLSDRLRRATSHLPPDAAGADGQVGRGNAWSR